MHFYHVLEARIPNILSALFKGAIVPLCIGNHLGLNTFRTWAVDCGSQKRSTQLTQYYSIQLPVPGRDSLFLPHLLMVNAESVSEFCAPKGGAILQAGRTVSCKW